MVGEDFNILKNNCREYAKNSKAVDVLRSANGKRHYTEVAKIIGIHQTTASGLLKMAEKFGLARIIKKGIYKKNPGVLTLMPKVKNKKDIREKDPKEIIKKLSLKCRKKYQSNNLSLKLSSKVGSDLNGMVKAYGLLYIIENTLRQMIRDVIGNEANWWVNHVPGGVQKDVKNSLSKESYHAAARNDKLEYTHLGHLKEIIINKKNWKLFSSHLYERNQQAFSLTVDRAIPSRNAIAHSIPLKKEDLKVVDVRFGDILKMIK